MKNDAALVEDSEAAPLAWAEALIAEEEAGIAESA